MLTLFFPCPRGVEPLLAQELSQLCSQGHLSLKEIAEQSGGVSAEGVVGDVMAANLWSRLASRVLVCVAYGRYHDEASLYQLAASVDWADFFRPDLSLRVDVTAQRSPLKSLQFATLKVKDAVCDVMREKTGERPSVDTQRPGVRVFAHLDAEYATIYLDTSGESLFKRGWRLDKGEAPLKENLAAAMLFAAQWQGDTAFLDPTCGSGTIAIEAAQRAANIAPGLQRPFAFERLNGFGRGAWAEQKARARSLQRKPQVPIFASDVSFRLVDFARRNAERAGVDAAVQFNTTDALTLKAPTASGTMMLNPPYGERIEQKGKGVERDRASPHEPERSGPRERHSSGPRARDEGELRARIALESPYDISQVQQFFSSFATQLKREFSGWSAHVLSPEMKLPQLMRLKESRRVPLWNGPIECRLFRFDMVRGSARDKPAS